VQQPEVLLLDEPLASLDTRLKSDLRGLLRKLNRSGQTIIHVTHDYEEAVSLGNVIAVIHKGEILQIGSPSEVFSHPKSEFVANFTGAKNFFRAIFPGLTAEGIINDQVKVKIASKAEQEEGYLLIRSEDIFLSSTAVDTSAINNYDGVIREIIPTIKGMEVLLDIGVLVYSVITAESLAHLELKEGGKCYVHFKASAVKFISA